MRWLAALLICFFATAFAAHVAYSAPEDGRAASDALKAEADALMRDIRYDEALAKYAEAYRLNENPALLYNQGRALESLGRYPEALAMLTAFEAKASPELRERVPNLGKLLSDVRGRTTLLTVTVSEPHATIRLGTTVLGTSPLSTLRVNAEKRATIQVSLEGFETKTTETELPPGGEKTLAFQLVSRNLTGILVIDSPVKGATVVVDGMPARQVPSEMRLPAGKHTVALSAPGYEDNTVEVVLGVGQRKVVNIEPGDSPVYERWWFWTIWGGALAAGGASVGIYAALTEASPDQGTIAPCQVKVTAAKGACAEPARFQQSGLRRSDELSRPLQIGPIPLLTVHF